MNLMADWTNMIVLFLLQTSLILCDLPPKIRIGTLLTEDQKDSDVEMMFKYSVMRLNSDPILLPNVTIEYDIQYALADDSFHAAKRACSQLESGVFGMFGPSDTMLGAHIQSICNSVDVPHMETRLDVESGGLGRNGDGDYRGVGESPIATGGGDGGGSGDFSVNLHPSYLDLTRAYKQLMEFLNWTRVAVIYEEDAGLIKMQDLVRGPPDLDMEVYIRQASPRQYRGVLREIKNKAIFNMIVDTKSSSIDQFLRAVLQLQMNDYRYHYIFTSFDTETFDLEDFRYNLVNITAFRLVDSDDLWVQQILSTIKRFQPVGSSIVRSPNVIKAETALMFDSVSVFAHGLHALANGPQLRTPNVTCDLLNSWVDGSTFSNYLNSVETAGLTGPIRFRNGKRHGFRLDLLKLMDTGMRKVGSWTVEGGVNVTDPTAYYGGGIPNITLLVTTIQEVPYVMKYRNETNGHEWFEGFCIDLLERIAQIVGFRYEIVEEPGRRFGAYNPETKEWDGLVKTIIDKKTDLAVASMTINYAREGVVDFTKPFMNLGISILFKIPTSQPTRLFSFMNPLAVEIWLYVMAAYILVSLTMFVMARFSPYEWNNPHPCFTDNDIVENQFNISNSFWFITGTLLRQGSGLNPKAMSTRIVGSIWWFFTLIIISSYTANLAAFLTVERTSTPIEGAADLANQDNIEYGTLEGGSTMAFFRDSKIDIYQKMWKFMESRKTSVFVADYEQGVKRVLQGNYAFLMESTGLDYIVQRNCNLTQVGGLLDSKGYGIATPVGSPWRDKISLAILDLQEKGVIQMLYNKWWKDTGDVCNRDEKKKDSKASALGIENIGGVFVVLLCGLALAIIVAVLEFCWNSSKNAQTDRQSICTEMANELKFAMRCHAPPQRPALRRSCSRCHGANTTHVPAPSLGAPIGNCTPAPGALAPAVPASEHSVINGAALHSTSPFDYHNQDNS